MNDSNNNICISINENDESTSISRSVSSVDPLASMIDAFASAVRGAGYGDDGRFIELAHSWAEMNIEIEEDDDYSDIDENEDTEDEEVSYNVGDIVRAISETASSEGLKGKIGTVLSVDWEGDPRVRFGDWYLGHGDENDEWYCERKHVARLWGV